MIENLITEIDILDEAKDNFLTYSSEVLTDRAIPAAEDGLLSAQRKIIWTMEDFLHMNSKSKTKKCNALVGTTLSTAYFHGDASCYGVLCKMSQPYLMRYPLIQGQGSLGTQENNDMVSSSRYTEAKPSVYADLMMTDYKKNVVPVKETYNNEYYEPVVLPSLFPNALCNGRQAIGIAMAHNSAPMCLTEVCNGIIEYIKNPNISIEELMEYIPGPDFPLGGTIINKKDIATAFKTGKSSVSLKIRGDYEIKDNQIIFTTIPYRTYRNKIREQISKNIEIFDELLEDFIDESSIGQNRLVFIIKKTVSASRVIDKLFALTDLQTTLSYNMNFIVNGTPKLCSLIDLIKAYVQHQNNIMIEAAKYDLNQANKRKHILEGLVIATKDIDKAIELIKNSLNKQEAIEKLITYFNITEEQGNAILEMKLARLTKLNRDDLLKELEEKIEIIAQCNKIISEEDFRNNLLIEKIIKMKDNYGDERRTKLVQLDIKPEEKEIINVVPEKCVVVLTEGGTIKRIPATSFRTQKRAGKGIKTQEDITSMILRTNTIDSLMIFSNKGKMYRLLVDDVPLGTNVSKGQYIKNLVSMEPNEEPQVIYSIYRDTDAKYVMFVTKQGIVKKTLLEEYIKTKKKNGIDAINLREGDSLAAVMLMKEEPLIIISKEGQVIIFNSTEIGSSGRKTMGIKGISLKDNDEVIAALPYRDNKDFLAIFNNNGLGKRMSPNELVIQKRAGKGLKCSKNSIAGACLVNDNDEILIVGNKSSICISASDLPELSRTGQGNIVLKDNKILSVSKI